MTPGDVYVNMSVVDSGVFTQLGRKKLPPRLHTMLILEYEVMKANSQHELYFPDEYIQKLFEGEENIPEKVAIGKYIYIYIFFS